MCRSSLLIAGPAVPDDAPDGPHALAVACFLGRNIIASFLSCFTGGCHTTKGGLFWLTTKPLMPSSAGGTVDLQGIGSAGGMMVAMVTVATVPDSGRGTVPWVAWTNSKNKKND